MADIAVPGSPFAQKLEHSVACAFGYTADFLVGVDIDFIVEEFVAAAGLFHCADKFFGLVEMFAVVLIVGDNDIFVLPFARNRFLHVVGQFVDILGGLFGGAAGNAADGDALTVGAGPEA